MIELKFWGHSCFTLKKDTTTILFDPFLTENPARLISPEDMDCNYILVSHGHFDHLGDTLKIGQRTQALVISTAEIARLCAENGCKSHGMHIGGKHKFDFGSVRITLAFHGSGVPGGHACGFIVNFFDRNIYFAGDTGVFADMALLGKLESIDYALLPIGDNFTMGPDDAVHAVEMLKPKHVVPMHYNTWPLIAQDPQAFKKSVETKLQIPVHVVEPGQSLTI